MSSKNLKALLEVRAAENTRRHHDAKQSAEFDVGRQHMMVPVDKIEPNPFQPRLVFNEAKLRELATTISSDGLGEPVLLRRNGDSYQIIAGERRWRAVKLLNHATIEALVIDADDAKTATLALVENMQREDLTDYEIALGIQRVLDQFPQRSRLAEYLGIERSDLYRYLAFNALPESVKERLRANPGLIGRVAASDIVKVLKEEEGSIRLVQRLEEALNLVESGRLEQTKVASYVGKPIDAARSTPEKFALTSAGKKVGSITWDSKNLVLKLEATALPDEKVGELRKFVEDLIK